LGTHNGVLAIAGQGFVSGTNFLTGVIVGRVCSKEQYGLYFLGFTLIVILIELQNSLISTPYVVFNPRLDVAEKTRYAGSTLVHQLALSWVAVLGLMLAGQVAASGVGPEGLAPVLWTLALAITFVLLRDFVRRYCFGNLRMMTALVFDAGIACVQISALLALAHFGLLTASHAYWAVGAACAGAVAVWFAVNRRLFSLGVSRAVEDFRGNWSFGKWVFASALLWGVSMNLYPWILTTFRGPAEAGVLAACLGICALGNTVLMGAQNFVFAKISTVYAEGGVKPLRSFMWFASLFFGVPMACFCAALWFFGDPLIVLLYGEKYAGNGLVVFILSMHLFALAMAFPFSRALFAIDRADLDFAINFIALFVLLSFGIWMVRAYGSLGAALGLFASNTAAFIARSATFLYCSRHALAKEQAL